MLAIKYEFLNLVFVKGFMFGFFSKHLKISDL